MADEGGGPDIRPWSSAWEQAAYGRHGYWTVGRGAQLGPAAFFRTSVHVGRVFHDAIARLVSEVDQRLDRPEVLDVVDVGSGRGELLVGLLDTLDASVRERVRLIGLDVRPRPDGLDPRVRWIEGAAPDALPDAVTGLIIANEWLDEIPVDVVALDPHDDQPRLVLVEASGREQLGPALDDVAAWTAWGLDAARAATWLERWWPWTERSSRVPVRAELGMARDDAWADVVARLRAGTALAIDYGHERSARPVSGTLRGVSDRGRGVPPVPDGSVNLTAHVAVDAVAEAVDARVELQLEALGRLGVSAAVPVPQTGGDEPGVYARELERASDGTELLEPSGLGRFRWIRVDR